MPKISISYRRADSEAMTGRIFDRLIAHYGKEAIFRDIDDIPAGIDFRQHINETLLKTHVLLAIVGPKWLGAARGGLERINEESDPVRVEVETALRRRLPIIPILIGNTRMPGSDQLPPSLKDFAFRNAVKVDTGRDFDHHIEHLIKSIDAILGQAPKSPPSRETDIAAVKPAAKADKPPSIDVVTPRKKDTGSGRAAATTAAAPASATQLRKSPAPARPETLPTPPRDWGEIIWPKSRQGRMIRLAGAAGAVVVLLALLVLGLFPGGSADGKVRQLFPLQNPDVVSALAISPDAQMIAAASLDRSVNIWNVGGEKLSATLSDSDGVSSVAFMPDGREIVYGGLNGIIVIADARGRIIRSLKPNVTYAWQAIPAVWSIAVSPDGTRVVSGSDDGGIEIWSTDGALLHGVKNHSDVVTALAFFPDGKTFASGSKDGTVRVWNTDGGGELTTLPDHSGQILSVAVSADGQWIAGGGSGSNVVIWDAASGRAAHVLASNFDTVDAVTFSPDSKRLFVGGGDATIEIWDVESGQRVETVSGNSHSVRALAFSQDGSRLASGGGDRTIDVWAAD
jgi:hypothetical protein